jgi:maleylpyruvate isomerase
MPAPAAHLELMCQGEAFFLEQMARLDDGAFARPSALPAWTRAHVVAHCARNADALGNLLDWARTGVETPMYATAEERAAGIEASARQDASSLRTDASGASSRLVAGADALPSEAWDAPVRSARGRAITAADVPWMRIRETWVHAVDLEAGATFAELPEAVVVGLVDEVAAGLAGRADCPAVVVRSGDRTWRIGPHGHGEEVNGDLPTILAWLIGRPAGDALEAPAVPTWL